MKPDMLIMAINKAKKKIRDGKENHKMGEMHEAEEQERILSVLKEELGIESSKMAEGDPVEFRVLGKIKTQDNNKYGVVIQRVSIPKEERIVEKPYPRPSPSA